MIPVTTARPLCTDCRSSIHTDCWSVKMEPSSPMNRRADQGQHTRARLVEVSTRLFAERGYDGTSIEAVLAETGVSRGSLYHHFRGKEALFEAVLDAVEVRIAGETLTALVETGPGDALATLRTGCLAWVRLAGDPVVQRIVLIDAPSVLGWERWREIEEQNALGTLKTVIQAASDEGRLPANLVDPFAHMVLATMNELALFIARAHDAGEAQRSAEAAVDEYLTRLLGA
jgi:AcrR family transcriptional regulator